MDKEKMEKRVGICPQPTMSSNLFFFIHATSVMSSDLYLLSFSVTCLFKKRKKRAKNVHISYIQSIDGACESSSDVLWYSDSLHHLASSSLSIVQLWHSKRDGYIWGMENRQGYYVWGLFSQNRVWHDVTVTRLKVFLAIPSTLPLRLPTPHFNKLFL